jgi:hypothetical protein
VVSDAGGPQEIIADGQTGLVAREGDLQDWQRKVQALLDLADVDPLAFRQMREAAVARVRERFAWSAALEGLFARPDPRPASPSGAASPAPHGILTFAASNPNTQTPVLQPGGLP